MEVKQEAFLEAKNEVTMESKPAAILEAISRAKSEEK